MRNVIRRLSGVVIALAVAIGFVMTASVSGLADETTGTITIRPAFGTEDDATNNYRIYKVFKGSGNGDGKIVYQLLDGKSTDDKGWTDSKMGSFFDVDDQGYVTAKDSAKQDGYLTQEAITAIQAYIASDSATWPSSGKGNNVYTASSTGRNVASVNGVPNGYYYINTTAGSVVSVTSTNHDATVIDKRGAPTIDKVITFPDSGASDTKKTIAQLGEDVNFKVSITIQKGTTGTVTFHDSMADGLEFDKSSVNVEGLDTGYALKDTPDKGDTFTISIETGEAFQDAAHTIVITYKAKVVSDTLVLDPATNKAHLTYGEEPTPTPPSDTEVYNARISVKKVDENGRGLAGAGFVLRSSAGKYYKYTEASGDDPAKVEWVDSIDDATEYTSDDTGFVKPFTGLAADTYTLIENTVPDGYKKADDHIIEVIKGDYSEKNLNQSLVVTDAPESFIPRTGGRGTLIFYIVGGAIVASAVVTLIVRKKARS